MRWNYTKFLNCCIMKMSLANFPFHLYCPVYLKIDQPTLKCRPFLSETNLIKIHKVHLRTCEKKEENEKLFKSISFKFIHTKQQLIWSDLNEKNDWNVYQSITSMNDVYADKCEINKTWMEKKKIWKLIDHTFYVCFYFSHYSKR